MASIEDLPLETLIQIFSYLCVKDLILGASSVCQYWLDVAQDSHLWRNISYRPSYSEKSEVMSVLKRTPKLKSFLPHLYMTLNAAEWATTVKVCQDLRKTVINIEGFSHEQILTIMKGLTKVEDLTIVCRERPYEFDEESSSIVYKYCKNLKRLSLSGCNVSSTALQGIYNLRDLEHLNLRGCIRLRDKAIGYLLDCHNLKYLDIGCTKKITDEGLQMCFNFAMLEVLKIHGCNISIHTLNLIPLYLKNLRHLTIRGDEYCRTDVFELQSVMPQLEIKVCEEIHDWYDSEFSNWSSTEETEEHDY